MPSSLSSEQRWYQPRRTRTALRKHAPNTRGLASSRCGRCSRRWFSRPRRSFGCCPAAPADAVPEPAAPADRRVRAGRPVRRLVRAEQRRAATSSTCSRWRTAARSACPTSPRTRATSPAAGRSSSRSGSRSPSRRTTSLDAAGARAAAVRLRARRRLHRPAGAALRGDRARRATAPASGSAASPGTAKTLVYAVSSVAYVDQVACSRRRLVPTQDGRRRHPQDRRPQTTELVPGTWATIAGRRVSGNADRRRAGGGVGERRRRRSRRRELPDRDPRRGDREGARARRAARRCPIAVALSPHVLATLERSALGLRIAWYDPDDGSAARLGAGAEEHEPGAVGRRHLIVFRGRPLDPVRWTSTRTGAHADEGGGHADRALDPGQPRRLGREHQRPRPDPRARSSARRG